MRELIFAMNVTLDGYVAAPGDDLGWSGPSDELFEWWLDHERAVGSVLYGRTLWLSSTVTSTADAADGLTEDRGHAGSCNRSCGGGK